LIYAAILTSEHWTYYGQEIEAVNDFNYLCTIFNYTSKFILYQGHFIGKALNSMNMLLCKCKDYDLTPKTLCQFFNAFVSSILIYSCEISGYSKLN
jgi:hypothetical protein